MNRDKALLQKAGIISSNQLVTSLAKENNVSKSFAIKDRHIRPNKWYFGDADMHAQNDKPLTKKQFYKRINEVKKNESQHNHPRVSNTKPLKHLSLGNHDLSSNQLKRGRNQGMTR